MGTIRLACLYCDNDEGDGLEAIPAGWQDVDFVQSYEDSVEEIPYESDRLSVWWTHIGVCPDCVATGYHPFAEEVLEA